MIPASNHSMTSRLVALISTLTLALCLSAAPRQATTPPHPNRTNGTHLRAKGIPNFGEVTPKLYRGGVPNNAGLESLKQLGINVVVDMRGPNKEEESAVTKLGMQYIAIPSHCPFPSDAPFAKFLRVLRENPDKKVFVHCRLGDDRTGMAVAAYRMTNESWTPDEAMKEMTAFGFTGLHHASVPAWPATSKTSPSTSSRARPSKNCNRTRLPPALLHPRRRSKHHPVTREPRTTPHPAL